MRDLNKIINSIQVVFDAYDSLFEVYNTEQFLTHPGKNQWSLAQVYNHLIHGAQESVDTQINKALQGSANSKKSKTFLGKVFFFLGSFPPIRAKLPASLKGTKNYPTKDMIDRKDLAKLRVDLMDQAQMLIQNPVTAKTKHPLFGYLTAAEWIEFIDMHFRHHLRQIKRIKKYLDQ
jgi:hypothetical protein